MRKSPLSFRKGTLPHEPYFTVVFRLWHWKSKYTEVHLDRRLLRGGLFWARRKNISGGKQLRWLMSRRSVLEVQLKLLVYNTILKQYGPTSSSLGLGLRIKHETYREVPVEGTQKNGGWPLVLCHYAIGEDLDRGRSERSERDPPSYNYAGSSIIQTKELTDWGGGMETMRKEEANVLNQPRRLGRRYRVECLVPYQQNFKNLAAYQPNRVGCTL